MQCDEKPTKENTISNKQIKTCTNIFNRLNFDKRKFNRKCSSFSKIKDDSDIHSKKRTISL